MNMIKKEPDSSLNLVGEKQKNFDPQQYYYDEELDLKWNENDSNYDANYKTSVEKSLEESKIIEFERNESNSQKRNTHLEKMNVNVKKTDTERNKINERNLQKYYYKEEVDIDWDEKDNNYDENYKASVEKSLKKSKIIEFERNGSNSQKRNTHLQKMNVNVKKTDTERNKINERNLQKYHYKEEVDIDWDEKDNNYEENHESYIEESIESSEVHQVKKNKSASILQQYQCRSRKRNKEIVNPDTAKDCPKCKKSLKNFNTLNKHLFYCGKAPHLQCDSCPYKAKYKNALIVHIMRNHPQQIPTLRKRKTSKKVKSRSNKIVDEQQKSDKYFRFCLNCNVGTDKLELNNCGKCESWLLYQCKRCNETLRTRGEFTGHMNRKCDPKGYYHCPACDYKSPVKATIKIHLKGHLLPGSQLDPEAIKWKSVKGNINAEQSFMCPSCDKQYQRNASLASHMRYCIKSQGVSKPPPSYVENENIKKARSCELARYCAKCNDEMQTNPIRKSKCCGSSLLYKCLKCNKTSDDHDSMKYHVKNICFKIKCDLCDYEGSKRRVAAHRLYHHDSNSVECPKCKTMMKNKSVLYDHARLCGKEPFKCDYCSFKVKQKYRLNAHILKHHPKKKKNFNADFVSFP